MSNRRHKLSGENSETFLVDVRSRFTFEPQQVYAPVGEKIHFAHGAEFEHTVIRPDDRVRSVNVRLPGDYQYASLIVYTDDADIVVATVLSGHNPTDIDISFPPGATKVYVSSAANTTKIFKRLLHFNFSKKI